MHLKAHIGASRPLQSVPTLILCTKEPEPKSQGAPEVICPLSHENATSCADNSMAMLLKCPRSSGPHESSHFCDAVGRGGHFAMYGNQMAMALLND